MNKKVLWLGLLVVALSLAVVGSASAGGHKPPPPPVCPPGYITVEEAEWVPKTCVCPSGYSPSILKPGKCYKMLKHPPFIKYVDKVCRGGFWTDPVCEAPVGAGSVRACLNDEENLDYFRFKITKTGDAGKYRLKGENGEIVGPVMLTDAKPSAGVIDNEDFPGVLESPTEQEWTLEYKGPGGWESTSLTIGTHKQLYIAEGWLCGQEDGHKDNPEMCEPNKMIEVHRYYDKESMKACNYLTGPGVEPDPARVDEVCDCALKVDGDWLHFSTYEMDSCGVIKYEDERYNLPFDWEPSLRRMREVISEIAYTADEGPKNYCEVTPPSE